MRAQFVIPVLTSILVLGLFGFSQDAAAETITWTGNAFDGGNWATAANWSTGTVPGTVDLAVIPFGAPGYPVITGNEIVGDLTIGALSDLTILGGSLTILNTGFVDSTATLTILGGGGFNHISFTR